MENKEIKIESSMEERFDKEFTSDYSVLGDGERIEINCLSVKPKLIKSFIQQEINLAVAKREREIVRKIQRMIDENSHIANYYDTAKEIINLIANK